jgi:hypothetical protein
LLQWSVFVKLILSTCAAFAAFAQSVALAATVTLTPSTNLDALTVGETFAVTLGADADFDPFFGGAIAVTYDADVISLSGGAAIDPPFMFSMIGAEPAGATGSTTVTAMFSAFADQPAGTDFLILNFEAVGAGVSTLTFSEATAGMMTGFINAASQQLQDVTFETATATVQPIPLPASGVLLTAGIAALIARRRTR